MSARPTLVFVVGPTASGKSDLAVEISETYGTEIINCDSVQFFAGVDIGAAKPSREDLERATHHLIGTVPIGCNYTAAEFRADALKVIDGAVARGCQGLLAVGGSGFYVQALEKGMFEVPAVSETARSELEKEAADVGGFARLHQEIQSRDPITALKIDPNDRYRILRALEILRAHSGTITEIRERFSENPKTQPFIARKLGLSISRETLRTRIVSRTASMLKRGLIDEVVSLRQQLTSQGKDPRAWSPLRSVGYAEVQDFLDGKISRAELEPLIVTSTMQLAKRQMTWFKRDQEIKWFDAEAGRVQALEHARSLLGPQRRD